MDGTLVQRFSVEYVSFFFLLLLLFFCGGQCMVGRDICRNWERVCMAVYLSISL